MPGRMIEVDRNKNEVWSYQRPNGDIIRAKKLPTGEVVFVHNLGVNAVFNRMDGRTQQITKTFQMAACNCNGGASRCCRTATSSFRITTWLASSSTTRTAPRST